MGLCLFISAPGGELLNLDAIAKAPLLTEPMCIFMVPGVLSAVDLAAVRADSPQLAEPGVFSLSELIFGPIFRELIAELQTPVFQSVIEDKWGVDLSDKKLEISIFGRQSPNHNEPKSNSRDEFVTCLLSLNAICDDQGGRLRMLRSMNSPDKKVGDIPLCGGTLASFVNPDSAGLQCKPEGSELRCLKLTWTHARGRNNGAS